MSKARNRNFRGWFVVAVSFLIMALQFAPGATLVGLFVGPLEAEFAASRTAVTTMMTIGILATVAGSLLAGQLMARFPVRSIMLPALVLCGLGWILSGMATSLMQLYLLAVVRGLSGAMINVIPTALMISRWFGDHGKGKAIGIATVGSGVGAVILTPIASSMIQVQGWRAAYLMFGIFNFLLLPLVALAFVPPKEEAGVKGAEAVTPPREVRGATAGQAARSGIFWLLFLAFMLLAGTTQTWNSNGVAYLEWSGFDALRAANIFAVGTVGLTVGKIVLGVVFDRFGGRNATLFGTAFLVLSCLLLPFSAAAAAALPAVAMMGFGMAVINIAVPLVSSDLFGNRDYSAILGMLQMAPNLGASIVPLLASTVYDRTGNYRVIWLTGAALSLLALFVCFYCYQKRDRIPGR